jgi:hypothetical protein
MAGAVMEIVVMLRYKLRTLMIVLAVMPPLLAVGWWAMRTSTDTAIFVVVLGIAAAIPLFYRVVMARWA